MSAFPTWYGVLDGAHSLLALHKLAMKEPECFGILDWRAILLAGGYQSQDYIPVV